MKGKRRLLLCGIIGLLLVISIIGYSQEVVYTNQITIAWDAITELGDGSPIPSGDIITYKVFIKDSLDNEILLGETSETSFLITLNQEGYYIPGVKAKRVIEGTNDIVYSVMNWSDEDGVYTPSPFVLAFFKVVPAPKNLRTQ